MRCLVTGGAGFIGSHLVERLVADGHEVRVWDDFSIGKNHMKGADYYNIDVAQVTPSTSRPVDIIFHLAAESRIQPSLKNPDRTHHSNVTGTLKVLEIAREHDARMVFAGTSAVYFDPYANPYAFTKMKAEEYCQLYRLLFNVDVAVARFFNVYGPRQMEDGPHATVLGIFQRQYRENTPLTITGDGEQSRDFVHVADIVDALVLMATVDLSDHKIPLDLGTGTAYSINNVAAQFKRPMVWIPARPGEAPKTQATPNVAAKVLGWTPKRQLKDYIDEFLRTASTVQRDDG